MNSPKVLNVCEIYIQYYNSNLTTRMTMLIKQSNLIFHQMSFYKAENKYIIKCFFPLVK